MTLVDNERVFGDLFMSEIVCSKKPNNFSLSSAFRLGCNSKFKGINSSDIIVENIKSVPMLLSIDQVSVVLQLVHIVHQGWCV